MQVTRKRVINKKIDTSKYANIDTNVLILKTLINSPNTTP